MFVDPAKPFNDVYRSCRAILDNEAAFPIAIEVLGSGTLLTEQGDAVVEDLVWVSAITLDRFVVSVITQSDAWLPFSFRREPQPQVHSLNAERLTAALQDVERQTGFTVREEATSDYVLINGFRLDNYRYADGSIADVS